MKGLIRELQDRGVLRVAGLYIALTWLLLQVADIVLPAFDLPDSVLRYALYIVLGGLPAVVLLAWFYEITPEGIVTEQEVRDQGRSRSGNQALTGITISALVLALGISLFVNFQQATDEPAAEPDLVSILVADFENQTGDPVFDGSLEAALIIGLEGASFVNSYPRVNAAQVAQRIKRTTGLDEETARLVSVREGIDLVLSGSIVETGDGYELFLRAVDPLEGNLVAEAAARAENKPDVLPAIGDLAAQIREALGDVSLEAGSLAVNESLTSTSLEAVKYFTQGQTQAFREENVKAIEYFEKAVGEDPEFGRAYTAWAHSEFKLGRREKSEELWQKALSHIDSMTERERYRTLGLYYVSVTGNQRKAIENYGLLVEKYPADAIGWNNLGVAYFYNLQFDQAMEAGAQLVELFPENPAFRANYALFAMYAGDFALARQEAEQLLEKNPGYFLAYLPPAMAELAAGDLTAAESVYLRMGEQGERARSVSITGLADIAMLAGDHETAAGLLQQGQESDATFGNSRGAAYKGIYFARALAAMGDEAGALEKLEVSLKDNNEISHLVPAALLYIDLGEIQRATEIREKLGSKLQQGHRAAADFLVGAMALASNDIEGATSAFNASLQRSDAWLTRFYLGRAYAVAGNHEQALVEFRLCADRIGESTALYLDDIPTFQYHAPLYYWLGRTRQELGMDNEASESLNRYLSLRVDSDNTGWTADARTRYASLLDH